MPVRARLLMLFAALVSLAACADLKALLALSNALSQQYHMQANVNLSNNHLTIRLPTDAVDAMKLDSLGREGFAHDVAAFTKAHYANASQLEDISIGFERHSSFGGAQLTVRETPYTFRVSDLP